MFDYQSDRHCSKTCALCIAPCRLFDYQSDRHCSKTAGRAGGRVHLFDYQSDRHCSKTRKRKMEVAKSLITSQIDTAPKPLGDQRRAYRRLITSQIDTAPKPLEQNPHCKGRPKPTGRLSQLSIKCRSTSLLRSCSYLLSSCLFSNRKTLVFEKNTCSRKASKSFFDKNVLRLTNTRVLLSPASRVRDKKFDRLSRNVFVSW